MQRNNEKMKQTLGGFQELDKTMKNIAAQSEYGVEGMIGQQADMMKNFQQIVDDSARFVLMAMSEQFQSEFSEDDDEMDEEEFRVWLSRLPTRFQRRVNAQRIRFEDRQVDGKISDSAMLQIINELLPEE